MTGGIDHVAASPPAAQSDRLVIHEWGTFTYLQAETGRSVPGINSDDEPVPAFVHRLGRLMRPSGVVTVDMFLAKGIPWLHPDVTMRLETPVVYFYPPSTAQQPLTLDVAVQFRDGWLSEYYPFARAEAPGLDSQNGHGSLQPGTTGQLHWEDLRVGVEASVMETDSQVWQIPRRVQAATVQAANGESEQYLFYRGVGQLTSPLTVARSGQNQLLVTEHLDPRWALQTPIAVRAAWLVDVREDGQMAFQGTGPLQLTGDRGRLVAQLPAELDAQSYGSDQLHRLRGEMHTALVAEGLFADEATAMLDTWDAAYFRSSGLRLFFLLPQAWTDAVLPLKVSRDADITRAMMGRIELVTPRHRQLLREIAAEPAPTLGWSRAAEQEEALPSYQQAYARLGRFRDALILDEVTRHPDSGLSAFATAYHLRYYQPQ